MMIRTNHSWNELHTVRWKWSWEKKRLKICFWSKSFRRLMLAIAEESMQISLKSSYPKSVKRWPKMMPTSLSAKMTSTKTEKLTTTSSCKRHPKSSINAVRKTTSTSWYLQSSKTNSLIRMIIWFLSCIKKRNMLKIRSWCCLRFTPKR